jgi:hypothetical protein
MYNNKSKFAISSIAEQPVYDHTIDPFEAILNDMNNQSSGKSKTKSNDKDLRNRELTDHSNGLKSNNDNQQRKRNRKSVKQQAESLFDFNAQPIKLSKFFSELQVESEFQFSTSPESEHNQIETKVVEDNSSSLNIQSAASVILSSKIVDDEIIFDYNLDCLFIEPIENEINLELPKLEKKFESEDKPSRELFVKRQLFSAVQASQQVDKEWTEEFFHLDKSLTKVNTSKLFDDDLDSIHELRKIFRRSAIDHHLIRDFFDFSEDSVNIQKLSTFGFKPGFELFYHQLIAMYVVFDDDSFIRKRDSTVRQLNEAFNFLPFDLSLRQIFNSIGIGFFNDYFNFTERIRLVAPFVAGRFKDKIKKNAFFIERQANRNIKKKKKFELQSSFDTNFLNQT